MLFIPVLSIFLPIKTCPEEILPITSNSIEAFILGWCSLCLRLSNQDSVQSKNLKSNLIDRYHQCELIQYQITSYLILIVIDRYWIKSTKLKIESRLRSIEIKRSGIWNQFRLVEIHQIELIRYHINVQIGYQTESIEIEVFELINTEFYQK